MKKDFFFWVWLFFGLAVSGWLWEVLLCLVKGEGFVNRGILKGPWLPIYGFGGVILSMLFNRWRKKPVAVFMLSMTAGIVLLILFVIDAAYSAIAPHAGAGITFALNTINLQYC